ncbi:hypothetical protein H5410_025625 [Solanum commersonii]|uniref:Uncharacterized protein n=1 Tax=Solanum commersonii TaxID=4109 RepID=A0A9J5YWD3_SOLCO|nr:hypothetical protein H5410_025625 [Solanum commersonii]
MKIFQESEASKFTSWRLKTCEIPCLCEVAEICGEIGPTTSPAPLHLFIFIHESFRKVLLLTKSATMTNPNGNNNGNNPTVVNDDNTMRWSQLRHLESPILHVYVWLQPIFVVICARDTTISYEELFENLLDCELFLRHEDAKKLSSPITTAVATPTKNNTNNHRQTTNSQQWRQSSRPNTPPQWHSNPNPSGPSPKTTQTHSPPPTMHQWQKQLHLSQLLLLREIVLLHCLLCFCLLLLLLLPHFTEKSLSALLFSLDRKTSGGNVSVCFFSGLDSSGDSHNSSHGMISSSLQLVQQLIPKFQMKS